MEEKPRLARLTAIITQLQSKKLVTAKYLSEKHDVSIRTIYRDIRTLEQSGIPIITEEGKGYSMMEGYQLAPVLFTQEEANALITAERLVSKNKDQSFIENYSSAIVKIKAVLKYSQKGKADLLSDRVYIGGNNEYERTSSFLMKIQSAITNFQLLSIEYMSTAGSFTQRDVEPFGIYSTNGNWLLIAFCRLRNDFRVFRIDLVQQLAVLNETFEQHNMTMRQFFEEYVQNKKHP